MKTEVHFHSAAFQCSVPRENFINEGCFGEDLCRWLLQQLRARGVRTADDPGQEDFGWYLNFHADEVEHCFVVGFQPDDPANGARWLGWVERRRGWLGSLFGLHRRGVRPEAVQAVDTALRASPFVQQVTWHDDAS